MKRLIAVLLIAGLLVGCGKQEAAVEPDSNTTPATEATEASTEKNTESAVESAVESTVEATDPTGSPAYRHPLTGEALDAPFTGHVTAVVVNNIQACQPQHGISQADIFYELETESGITRNLAMFTEFQDVEKLGPVRSARTFFIALAKAYQAPLIHCGAGGPAKQGAVDEKTTIPGPWIHIDANAYSKYFYRDQARLDRGVAYEHTLFTTGEKVLAALEAKEYVTVNEDGLDMNLHFNEAPAMSDEAAAELTVTFLGSKTTSFTYDEEAGLYTAHQYGDTHIDGNTGEPVTYRNVMALYANHKKIHLTGSKVVRSFYDLIGSGEGHLACDGKIIPIRWSHDDYDEPFTYTLEDGTPLELGVGRTYIAVTGAGPVAYK